MQESVAAVPAAGLSEGERLIDTFVAPSKTFTDILRNARWWLPCVIIIVLSFAYSKLVLHKVGAETMASNMIATMPRVQEAMAKDAKTSATIQQQIQSRIQSGLYTAPFYLIAGSFIGAGLFMATTNFVFGGKAKYKHLVAVFWYASLPLILSSCLVMILLSAGVNVDTFQINNPLGTNIGYYMQGSSPALTAILSYIDLFSIWVFALQVIGVAKVGEISAGKAVGAVLPWWLLYFAVKLIPVVMFA